MKPVCEHIDIYVLYTKMESESTKTLEVTNFEGYNNF